MPQSGFAGTPAGRIVPRPHRALIASITPIIRLRSGEAMFFAAIGQLPPAGSEVREDDGFVIITADAQGGMQDIHDRRPVVLPADLAREWIDPNTTPQRAEQIVGELGLQSEEFEWYQVSKAVGNVKNTGAALIAPLDSKESPDWL